MTIALSPSGASVPYVLYATGTLCSTAPDSSSTCGMIAIVWSGMSLLNGFSGCEVTLSVRRFSCCVLGFHLERLGTDGARMSRLASPNMVGVKGQYVHVWPVSCTHTVTCDRETRSW